MPLVLDLVFFPRYFYAFDSSSCITILLLLFLYKKLSILQRADLRWNRKSEDMEQLKSLQDELLDAASMLVKPGGVLVYSTCSIDPEENEQRVAAFLLRHQEYSIESSERYISPEFLSEEGYYFSSPVNHSLDGAFAARLLRCS